MKNISKADIKKAILAVEAERWQHPAVVRPNYAKDPKLLSNRRASEKMVRGFLMEAGLDIKKFEALQRQRSIELERIANKHKTDALQRASRQKGTLHPSIVAQSKALGSLAAKSGFFPHPTFSLDTPFLIWPTPLGAISDSAAVPFGSWAKFKIKTSETGTQKVGFYFYWANPYTDYAVINATTFLAATGHLKSHAPYYFVVNNSSWVEAWARFGLWFGFPQAESGPYESVLLGRTGAYAHTATGPETNELSISTGVNLSKTMFAVPPGTVVVFEVAVTVDYVNDAGDVEADFESGNFKIACPVVVFSLLNMPPVVMG